MLYTTSDSAKQLLKCDNSFILPHRVICCPQRHMGQMNLWLCDRRLKHTPNCQKHTILKVSHIGCQLRKRWYLWQLDHNLSLDKYQRLIAVFALQNVFEWNQKTKCWFGNFVSFSDSQFQINWFMQNSFCLQNKKVKQARNLTESRLSVLSLSVKSLIITILVKLIQSNYR